MEIDEVNISEGVGSDQQRKFPWLLDIFLFPTSTSGLTIIGIYVFTGVLLRLIELGLGGIFYNSFIAIILVGALAILDLVVTAYLFWYFGICVRESALGKIRSPETLDKVTENTWEMVLEMVRIASCLFICLGPSLTYYLITNCLDWIYWSLLFCGAVFLPMALLGVVMFDSLSALNPVLIIPSVFSTFFKYGLLLIMCSLPAGIAVIIVNCLPDNTIGVLGYILRGVSSLFTFATGLPISLPKHVIGITSFLLRGVYAYLALIVAHILGRFYYCNAERLNWEV